MRAWHLRWANSPVASAQRKRSTLAACRSTWNKHYTNECQSRDSNHSATNAGSTRTKFCVFREAYDRQRTLVIRIAAITLASDSAITLARFRPSKHGTFFGKLWFWASLAVDRVVAFEFSSRAQVSKRSCYH